MYSIATAHPQLLIPGRSATNKKTATAIATMGTIKSMGRSFPARLPRCPESRVKLRRFSDPRIRLAVEVVYWTRNWSASLGCFHGFIITFAMFARLCRSSRACVMAVTQQREHWRQLGETRHPKRDSATGLALTERCPSVARFLLR
jgi:hypothetical protein